MTQTSQQDRPIERESEDALDRGPFINSLIRALIADDFDEAGKRTGRRATGFVVGLTGKWGLGKSSILNLLSQKLGSMDEVVVATFNPWLFKGRDELLAGFFNELRGALGRSKSEQIRELQAFLDKYWLAVNIAGHAVAGVAAVHGAHGANKWWSGISAKGKSAIAKQKTLSPAEERRSLEEKLKSRNAAIVVLIDELDRVEDDDVRAVAQLIKAVGDIKGMSYLVAYDPDRVADALGRGEGSERKASGEHYLEKIIQHPIPVRPLFTNDVAALLDATLDGYGLKLPPADTENEKAILDHLHRAINTPREVKRTVGAFSVLEAAVRGEVAPYDVLGYCWILTKTPSLRDIIAEKFDLLVDDPSSDEMAARVVRRMNRNVVQTPVDMLGEVAKRHEELLQLLFPRFGTRRESREQGTQIALRRNLVRLLYLGNPPGMVTRPEIEAIWKLPTIAEAQAALTVLLKSGRLGGALDRFDDLLSDLPANGDMVFWPALAHALMRDTDWITEPNVAQALTKDAGNMLMRIGLRQSDQIPRVKAIIEALISYDDQVLVPFVLRRHLFTHGLTRHGGPRGNEMIYDAQETRDLLAREASRYLTAIENGIALKRLPSAETIFVLSNARISEDELKRALTEQLKTPESFSTLASMLVPPGYGIDHQTLVDIFDVNAVQANLAAMGDIDTWQLHPWVAGSAKRMQAVLEERDPDDPDDNQN